METPHLHSCCLASASTICSRKHAYGVFDPFCSPWLGYTCPRDRLRGPVFAPYCPLPGLPGHQNQPLFDHQTHYSLPVNRAGRVIIALQRHTPCLVGCPHRLNNKTTSQGSSSKVARSNKLPWAPQWGQRSNSSPNISCSHSVKFSSSTSGRTLSRPNNSRV